jgi:large subunit ribosomal protein L15
MSILNNLVKITTKKKKRVGRGYGSGRGGHTSGKGMKGQLSRTGGKVPIWFEGGQLPLTKRLPMLRGKGRFNIIDISYALTLNDLNSFDFSPITMETIKKNKIVPKNAKKVKIIKGGGLNKKVIVKGIKVSKGAKEVIEKLGGKVENK